jgi:hypothetical protein
MSDYYCTISVENSNTTQLKKLIEEEIGEKYFDISIEIEDRSEIYSYTSKFMEEHNLEEQDPVLNSINLSDFVTDIDLYCTGNSFGMLILDIVADAIGYKVSQILNTRALVTLTNQETPFCLFESGFRKVFFAKSNLEYFDDKPWVPKIFLNMEHESSYTIAK